MNQQDEGLLVDSAEAIATLENWTARKDGRKWMQYSNLRELIRALDAALDAALREARADREDAERYRWLRDSVTLSSKNNYMNATGLNPKGTRRLYRLEWYSDADGDLDEILDAARKAGEAE